VARIEMEPQRRSVLAAVGQIARELHLATIVEGVERSDQRRLLLELGFTTAQGFLLGRPADLPSALGVRQVA
jgi:EAL domain-containing protein (putative c-di-GMP-specific phosphodiesterase class I)